VSETPVKRDVGGTWDSLRRRKVVQWGLAYAAAAWVLLQVVGFAADAFAWQPLIKQLAMLGLVLGLPLVLALAWYHGDRGQQRVTGTELAVLTLMLFLGGSLLWLYAHRSEPTTTATTGAKPAAPSATADPRPSIAVLPFENRSRLVDDAFFVDGIHDDVLMQLSKISALKVISRTSVERFRDTDLSVQQIAQQLGVRSILEGGVQRSGDRVRIHVQLIDATTDAHLWAESYDRALTATNIFAIQSEVAASIAVALKAALTPSEQARARAVPTQNLQAWEAYQLGKQRMERRASADIGAAEQSFRKAIDLDPQFALAYVGLADTIALQLDYSGAPRESTLSNAEQVVAKALELDPNLAEAWASSGLIANYRQQFDRAEAMFRRALELNPNYAPARHWYSTLLTNVGRPDESLVQMQRAVELDPFSTVIKRALGDALTEQGRFHEAEATYWQAITIDPSRPSPYVSLAALNAYAFDRFTDAVPLAQKAMELDPGSPRHFYVLARMYFELGDDSKFFETNAQAAKRWPDYSFIQFQLAVVNLVRLDAAGAVRHAQRAFDLNPRFNLPLSILRNADLQNGRYDAAFARYGQAYPELFVQGAPRVDRSNFRAAIDLAWVLQKREDSEAASVLLDGAARVVRTMPRLGLNGYGISDVAIHVLRGQKAQALAALRYAEKAGWRGPGWRYYRDFDPNLASIRNEREFKAIFADVERDMARQRAALAARPKGAPLDLQATGT
jgi:TolB-like protein/cytochrome c-type biogenesis protein CcmH/NrfG